MLFSTFRRNGFLLEEDMHAPSGHRYKLKAVPFSKNITFGVAGYTSNSEMTEHMSHSDLK